MHHFGRQFGHVYIDIAGVYTIVSIYQACQMIISINTNLISSYKCTAISDTVLGMDVGMVNKSYS